METQTELEESPEKLAEAFVQEMKQADQFHLYMTVSALFAILRTVKEDLSDKNFNRKDLQMLQDIAHVVSDATGRLWVAIKETERFGVESLQNSTDPMLDSKGEPTEFAQWFNHWAHFIHSLSEEDWLRLKEISESGGDTSTLQPPGAWKVDKDAMRDGVVPKEWVQFKVDSIDIKRDFGAVDEPKVDSDKLEQFKSFFKGDDEVWVFEDPKTWQAGYVAVCNKRPVAKLTIVLPKENE